MQIKQQMLVQLLKKNIAPLYVLIGQEYFLLEENLITIKSIIKESHNFDEKKITIEASKDWANIPEEANSYSLFSETILLNIFYDKKSIDSEGKKVLSEYLKTNNSRCFMIIRAPNLPAKQLQWLSNHDYVVVVVATPLNMDLMKNWIKNQLKKNSLGFDHQVPDLIYNYTQGNMLACAQVIEKITLTNTPNNQINTQHALEHLSDQCVYTLFELIDACLLGQADKAIHILRQAANNKTEATLILWMLTQEIRLMVQLSFRITQNKTNFRTLCNQLKIWPQRIPFYQSAIKRLTPAVLEQQLRYCKFIDEQIKSNLNTQVWNTLEKLSLSLCEGEPCIL